MKGRENVHPRTGNEGPAGQ